MSVSISILGWKANGLRCPDHEIICTDTSGKHFPVSLIQMPNGTGKTTTLNLLRAALSGSAQHSEWNADTVREYQKRESSTDKGYFEVRLSLNNSKVTILMDFDFDEGSVSYHTTINDGKDKGFNPPPEFLRFMNEDFVNFFIFDGELAEHLLDKDYSDAKLVVEKLFRINLLVAMSRKVEEYWTNISEEAGAKGMTALTRRNNHLKDVNRQLLKCKEEKQELTQRKNKLTDERDKKQIHYDKELKKGDLRTKNLMNAESEHKESKLDVQRSAEITLELMRNPHAIHASISESMVELKDGLDRVKLPESVAREFFEDMAQEEKCICGRPIDKDVAAAIRERSTSYLGNNDVIFLNSMKAKIKEEIGNSTKEKSKKLDSQLKQLEGHMSCERKANDNVAELVANVESSNPKAQEVRNEIEKLNTEIVKVEGKLEWYERSDVGGDVKKIYGIEVLNEMKKEAEEGVAKMTKTLKVRNKRNILVGILEVAHTKAREAIISEIRNSANRRIVDLMPNSSIVIKEIRENLVLEGQEGGSVGETLSVAYAFLATMFNSSDYELPFVVDSPAGAIDFDIRQKIGELIPNLTNQFIAFTISSERATFVDSLKEASSGNLQFITLFDRKVDRMKSLAKKLGKFDETCDGIMVEGEEFFMAFQLKAEEK